MLAPQMPKRRRHHASVEVCNQKGIDSMIAEVQTVLVDVEHTAQGVHGPRFDGYDVGSDMHKIASCEFG